MTDELERELATHGLTPFERLTTGTAPLLLRVRDASDRTFIVKLREDYWVAHEHDALELLAAVQLAPSTTRLGDQLLLLEDLGDPPFPDVNDPEELRAVGKFAQALHQIPTRDWCATVQAMWQSWAQDDARHARFSSLPTPQAQGGQHLLAQLASGPTEAAFLHGDLIPDNILNTTAGLRAVDPYGLSGDPAFDLATFASRCPDPPWAMDALLAGYGNEPPRTPEWLEFCCLYTAHQAPFSNEPVATGLQRFLNLPSSR